MSAMTDLSKIRFTRTSAASRIAKSPVLIALLDQDKLASLVADVIAATRVAAEARILADRGATDLTGMIDTGIRGGTDPAQLLDQLVAARSAASQRTEVAAMLASTVNGYRDTLECWLGNQVSDLIDNLTDALEDLLDRAEETVTALGEVRDAEAAIDAGQAAQWAALRTLHEEYAALREGHVALLRAADPSHFGVGSDALAFAFFASPLRAWPQLAEAHHGHARRDGFDYQGVAPAPFDLTDPGGLDHFLAAVTRRAEFGTHVADAKTADAAHRAAIKAAAPPTLRMHMVGGRLTTYYGSEAAVVSHALRR